jgi:hypothetical protein
MADLFQGSALPDVKTTQTAATTAPDWYSNFLSGLSSSGQQAVQQGGVAGFAPLQQQAFAAAPTAIQAGQPALTTAQTTATDVAQTPATSMISQYMNPYTQSVVEEINRLGQRQFQESLAPGATAGAVGSGQFGSTRGMQVYGNVARDVNRDILGRQATALQTGFDSALKAAQNQQALGIQSAQTLGNIGQQQYTQGTGGLNVLSGLGAQQQALEQARLNYPMTAQQNLANIMRGFTVPTTQTQTYQGPMPGAYQLSPLSQILGLTSGAAGILTPKYDSKGNVIPDSSLASILYKTLSGSLPGASQTGGSTTPPYMPGGNTQSPDNTVTDMSGNTYVYDPNTEQYYNQETGEQYVPTELGF